MNVAIELPEDIAKQLKAAWQDMPRRALEAVAAGGYRSEAITDCLPARQPADEALTSLDRRTG